MRSRAAADLLPCLSNVDSETDHSSLNKIPRTVSCLLHYDWLQRDYCRYPLVDILEPDTIVGPGHVVGIADQYGNCFERIPETGHHNLVAGVSIVRRLGIEAAMGTAELDNVAAFELSQDLSMAVDIDKIVNFGTAAVPAVHILDCLYVLLSFFRCGPAQHRLED